MAIKLLDGSLLVDIYFEHSDKEFEDNICVHINETCPDEEKIFCVAETNVYLTPEQAKEIANLLLEAAEQSSHASR